MNQALLHDSFEYPISEEADCDPLEQHAAFSSNPPSFDGIGTGAGFRQSGNGSMSQPSMNPLALHVPNGGYEYRSHSLRHSVNDTSFQSGSAYTISPLASSRGSCSASPSSAASSYAVLNPHASYNIGQHSNASSSTIYPPAVNYPQSVLQNPLDVRPRFSSMASTSGMQPPSRPSTDHSPISSQVGISIRGDYVGSGAHLPRHSFSGRGAAPYQLSRSQSPLSAMSRSLESSLGGTGSGQNAPPFDGTKSMLKLTDRNGRVADPSIAAKIDKGFFQADEEWVCYRRNYFAVVCSFELSPGSATSEPLYVARGKSQSQVLGFYMTISAKMDGEDGKAIPLVQHTPKRDKGPMSEPDKKEVYPNPGGNLHTFQAASGGLDHRPLGHCDYDGYPVGRDPQVQMLATFERMQFKRATANNGKRRAAQQYFYILVELHCKTRNDVGMEQLVKVAHRVSSKMVVRGRSPGHYQDERRGSNMGPGAGHLGGFQGGPGHYPGSGSATSALGGSSDHSLFGSRGTSYQRHHPGISQPPQFSTGPLTASSPAMHTGLFLRGMPELMHPDDSTSDYMYGGSDFGSSMGPPTPRPSNALRPTSGSSPVALPATTIYGYQTPPFPKEELRIPSIKSEDDRHHSGLKTPCVAPAFANSWHQHEGRASSREYKPYSLDNWSDVLQ